MSNIIKSVQKQRKSILKVLLVQLNAKSEIASIKAAQLIVKYAELDKHFEPPPKRKPGQRGPFNMRNACRRILKVVVKRLYELMEGDSDCAAVGAAELLLKIAGPSNDPEVIEPLVREVCEIPTENV